jgi:hypothetical protein
MTDETSVLRLLSEISGLNDFWKATVEAHYWLSAGSLLRAVAALWLIVCTLVFSVRLVRVALPRMTLPLRWASIMGAGTFTATMGFHALRGLKLFNLPAALVCCTALGAGAVFVKPALAPWSWALAREWRALVAVTRLFARGKYGLVSALFAGYLLLIAARSLIVPPVGWDTITYHGPRMVQWLQSGQFTFDPGPGPHNFYRHFISGGEVLMTWALLPFHTDLLANLTSIVQWLGVGSAAWGLARALGVREPFAASSAGLTMFLPVLAFEMNTGYVEAPLNLALLLGIALSVWCMRRPSGATAVAAAMALGVAAGIKLPGAPPGVVVLTVLLVRILFVRRYKVAARLGVVALSCVAFALPLLPWAYQAYAETGYPLSPMPIKVFGMTLGVVSPAMQWYQERSFHIPYSWDSETNALRLLFSDVSVTNEILGPSLGTSAFIPLLVSALGLLTLLRKRPLIALTLAAAMAAPWAAHFSQGLSVPRLYWAVSVARYLIALMGMALPVSMVWCRADSTLAQTYRRLLLVISLWTVGISLRLGFGVWEMRELMIALAACLLLGTCIWLLLRDNRRPLWPRAAGAVLVFAVGCSALQQRRDQTRFSAYTQSFALHSSPRYWAMATPFVDEPGKQHRIALTGGPAQNADNWFHYFFYGSRFQNTITYVPPTKDGGIAHFGPHGDFAMRTDMRSWLGRLSQHHITEVLVFPPYSIEQTWMDTHPDLFEKAVGMFDWGLYRVRKP